ncbi:MAG: methyltransferase domain-containing protein [Rubrivivax sp.]
MNPEDSDLAALQAQSDALSQDPRFLALLRARWPQLGPRLSTRIHPADQMLLHSLRHHRDPNAALAQYFNVALQQYHAARQVLDALLPPAHGRVEVLDFACGFGRLIRFLCCCERDLAISVSEIQPEALQFVAAEFGVRTLPSAMQPEAFQPGQRFDFIWVASLFSHLPESLFHRWLQRLLGLLTPDGVLCFSVHGEALVPPGERLPPGGLLFKGQSENAELDPDAYGTTYVSEAFVRAAIARAAGGPTALHRVPKGLAHEQDLYVVPANAQRDLGVLAGFRRGPWGWADERRIDAQGRLVLRGWAASIDDGALGSVSIRIDDEDFDCPTGQQRLDVRDAFGDARLAHAGWSFERELPAGRRQPWVQVTAGTARGECALLYAGWPGGRPASAAPPAETPAAASHVYRREIDMAQRSSLSVLAGLVAPGSRVLDLGTGSGSLGRLLRQRGCRVDGVTLNAAEREAAQDGYERLELLDLEQPGWAQRFAAGAYDYVVCADVLEHLREPERVLQACRGLLRADGWLLASVPNVAYAGMVLELMHGDWKYGPEGLLDRTHLRFYTRRSFTRVLQSEGWQVERVEPVELTWYYTEFWTPFDRLPPAVARYLLAQPDASAYQLVFAARPADTAAASAAHPKQAAVPPADPAVQVAVFASTLEAADAERRALRIARLGRVGAHRQTLSFEIPAQAQPGAGLRWHAADRPGYLHLQAITLHDREGRAVWHWQAGLGADERIRQASRQQIDVGLPEPSGQALVLRLSGDEPCLQLPLDAGGDFGAGPWRLDISCGWPFSADYLAVQGAPVRESVVEVIVPVYNGLPHLQQCLASVMAARCRTPWHLTVIDDASPDPAVGRWLREFAALHPDVTVLTNARNLGFTGSVNLGMRLAGRRDVLLLNSDTEVADGWIDRLRRAADGGSRVGTVTPFSNNATICSFPRFCEANALPAGQTTATLDRWFARLHAERTVDVPTAVGFCMYIRRDCLEETGLFDAEAFGAGYGEENDFCLRASARGWRHLHALDVFVRHAGGASFSDRQQALQADALAQMRRLHPQYEDLVRAYVQRDPARPFREAVLQALESSA